MIIYRNGVVNDSLKQYISKAIYYITLLFVKSFFLLKIILQSYFFSSYKYMHVLNLVLFFLWMKFACVGGKQKIKKKKEQNKSLPGLRMKMIQ